MYVRHETAADAGAVHQLVGDVLDRVLTETRRTDAWLPALAFVAVETDERIVGHVAGVRGQVNGESAVALTPPAVHTDHRDNGIGSALMYSVLGAADAVGERLAGITASPAGYYTRFGFRPAAQYDIAPSLPAWEPYFQVRTLTTYTTTTRGQFRYRKACMRS